MKTRCIVLHLIIQRIGEPRRKGNGREVGEVSSVATVSRLHTSPASTPQQQCFKMVQLRGISVNAISQLDADRLPESSIARAFGSGGAIAACYMPIRPGAQLWFEYSIDGPHPPQAAYFFKMFLNGQVVISWVTHASPSRALNSTNGLQDCTAKHDYYGKLVYSLHVTKSAIADKLTIAQKSITFASTDSYHSPNFDNDCVEIRVHRIEHRRRLRALTEDDAPQILPQSNTAVRSVEYSSP